MQTFSVARRFVTRVCALALLVFSFVVAPIATMPVGAQDAPDGSRSTITQSLIDREPRPGGGWRVTIEATLDSNAVCHVLVFQCVVEPELTPANMTLVSVECLSPAWANIAITLPFVGAVDVCARFDAERAGRDQRFRFVYDTDLDVGTLTETVRFFRFPEEFFFTRAQNTITIDLDADADISEQCPDLAAIGTQVSCAVRVEALSGVPTASVSLTNPAQFTNVTLVPDVAPGDWDCTALTSCDFIAAGTLPPGVYTFTALADVVGPPADVQDCAAVATSGTLVASGCADVRVDEDDTDTFLDIEKTTTVTEVLPGSPISYTITVTNLGPNPATAVEVFETPPALLNGAAIAFVGGSGTWACASAAVLSCTSPTLAVGGVATFQVAATVSGSAPAGAPIVNEIAVDWANNPFGPDVPARDGDEVFVAAAVAVLLPPRFTG